MLLSRLAHVSQEVAATSARSHKIALLAELFRDAGPEDVPIVIPYLAGRLPQGRLGISWKMLDQQVPPAAEPSLTVLVVDARLTAIGAVTGAGSQAERGRLVSELLAAATADEQRFLFALITGEVRQGALDAVAVEGLAAATEAPPADVRRAVMLAGSIQPVAQALLADGPTALARFRLTVGRPVLPMLAHSATSVAEAVEKLGACAVEEKLDGIRVQVHRDGDDVRLYTRTLDDITDRLPELTTAARTLRGERFILDGEVIAFDTAGRPRSFQETAGRVGSRVDVETAARDVPVSPVFFDALSVDGHDLLDLPFAERHTALARLVPEPMRVRRLLVGGPADLPAAEEFLADTLARGHEGVVVKALDAPYSAGRRGAAWLKVKPVHTLDLVVLAAEWGHGRRTGKQTTRTSVQITTLRGELAQQPPTRPATPATVVSSDGRVVGSTAGRAESYACGGHVRPLRLDRQRPVKQEPAVAPCSGADQNLASSGAGEGVNARTRRRPGRHGRALRSAPSNRR
ncbi:ATP-dependent DNA ligase [Streptomyces sp. NPDC005474]|uniref:ATP-dependent DNA ligase n=1 Tax=Streptomyces sp. NPDC005474 TaxID=3154878 RepID=UPI0034532F93